MRGKDSRTADVSHCDRITPAYAGKSQAGSLYHKHTGDHPRLCGEKEKKAKRNATIEGSPPPMRGKEGGKLCAIIMPRITPAYAGKRRISVGYLRFCGDHPRLCGEKSTPSASDSSPVRITPAYAGKSVFIKSI